MELASLLDGLAALADKPTRGAAARQLASTLGGDDALILLRDERTGALVPAEGFAATLPGGAAWAALLRGVREPGVRRFDVPVATKSSTAALCCVSDDIVLVVFGGEVPDATARSLLSALPLLATALRAERAHAVLAGELESARREVSRAGTIV
ncbi:MAG TPA: hypothetical protein VND91_07000, partial [Candidatus Saccharimonadia bacterium]|nr:hypothetical protein [Candidatus Saccharimonadia bacterium]